MRWTAIVIALMLGACGVRDDRVGTWYGPSDSPVPDGQPLVLSVEAGTSHCGWGNVVFLTMAWPLDQPIKGGFMSDRRTHVYVWQPDEAYDPTRLATTPAEISAMPGDARYSGLHRGDWQLWVAPSLIQEAVFLQHDDTIQRWAYVRDFVGCQ